MWHKALQSACQKYLTNLNQKSEFALVIRALHHGAKILLMWLSGALKPQPPARGKNHGRGQEAAQDVVRDEWHARLALERDPGDLVKSGPHRRTDTNLSSSTTLPEKQKVQETQDMTVKDSMKKTDLGERRGLAVPAT